MNSVKIDVYISDLLYQYDCVIVPEFGGFVANYASAKIHPIHHRFVPPSKEVSFNKNLNQNDGLLSNHIAERKFISYEESNALLKAFVNQTIEELKRGDKIVIEKVGTLYLDPERNIQFVAESENDFLGEAFGLTAFRALPIKREREVERIEQKIVERLPVIKESTKEKQRLFWPAAAVLFFAISLISINAQMNWLDTSNISYSHFFGNDSAPVYSVKNKQPLADNRSTTKEFILMDGIFPYQAPDGDETQLFVDNRQTQIDVDNTKTLLSESRQRLSYHVLAGCFSQRTNAINLVSSLRAEGFDAQLLEGYKSYYAVSFGSFVGKSEAITLLRDVKSRKNPQAWLLHKTF